MPQPPNVPSPTTWWEGVPAASLVGSKDAGLVAKVNADGRLDGPMTRFAGDEPLIESWWKDGVQHGPQTVWRAPFTRTGAFVDGRPHGRWTLYWNEHTLVWNEFERGAVVESKRENELSRTVSAKPQFIVNGKAVASLDAAIAMGDEVQTLAFAGWNEGPLPDAIWGLKSLRELMIRFSVIRPIPAGIGQLRNLQVLDIEGCNIGWVDKAIGDLKQLRQLRIVNSGLGVFPPVRSPALVSVDISQNVLARVNHSLADCPALGVLKMRDNYIMTLDEHVFSAPALRMLDLTGSFWVSWISPAVGDAAKLVNLTLYEQCLQSLPAELARCTELQNLNLYGAHLVDPPVALGARPIGQLNLEGTPLHALPGFADFEAQLRDAWASKDDRVAAQVALEELSPSALGLEPPRQIASFDGASRPVGGLAAWGYAVDAPSGARDAWSLDAQHADNPAYEALRAAAVPLSSGDFGCENGDEPVRALLGPSRTVDVPLTEVLVELGVLRPCDTDTFRARALRLEGSPLVDVLAELAPVEAWALDVLPDSPHDLKLAMLVMQLDAGVWAAVGPTLERNSVFRATPDAWPDFEPADGRLRELVTRDLDRSGGAQLCYQGLDRRVGDRSTLAFGRTRHRALARYLTRAGVCGVRELDRPGLEQREGLGGLGALLGELGAPQQIAVGGVSLFHRVWLGQTPSGEVAGIVTRTVNT